MTKTHVGMDVAKDQLDVWVWETNELTAIRQRLANLEREGRVVSIDALACQPDSAQTIAEGHGWYLLAVKDNPSDLHAHRQRDCAYRYRTGNVAHDRSETVERGHGRTEHHACTIMGGAHGLRDELDPGHRWTALGCAVRVVVARTLRGRTARYVRYYITHLPVDTGAARVAHLVRGHWGCREQPALSAGRQLPGRPLPPAYGPCRVQHGCPATHRLELPDHLQAVFLAQDVNSTIAQDGGPQPRPTGATHGLVTTLSTPCGWSPMWSRSRPMNP